MQLLRAIPIGGQHEEFIVFDSVTQACRTQPLPALPRPLHRCVSAGRREANEDDGKLRTLEEVRLAGAVAPPTPAAQVRREDTGAGGKTSPHRATLTQPPPDEVTIFLCSGTPSSQKGPWNEASVQEQHKGFTCVPNPINR